MIPDAQYPASVIIVMPLTAGGRVAAQEHQRVGLLERRRRLDAGLLAVVGAEAEPHLGVGLRRAGVSVGPGQDGVDADAPLAGDRSASRAT